MAFARSFKSVGILVRFATPPAYARWPYRLYDSPRSN